MAIVHIAKFGKRVRIAMLQNSKKSLYLAVRLLISSLIYVHMMYFCYATHQIMDFDECCSKNINLEDNFL